MSVRAQSIGLTLATILVLVATGQASAATSGMESPASIRANFVEHILNKNSGKCLEIEDSRTDNGARAQQWDCVGQAGANWYPVANGDGSVRYVNNNSGKCLEVADSSTANGARVQQWDCVGIATQSWTSVWDAGVSGWRQVNKNSGKCLEVEDSSTANGARVQQWDCVGIATQAWVSG